MYETNLKLELEHKQLRKLARLNSKMVEKMILNRMNKKQFAKFMGFTPFRLSKIINNAIRPNSIEKETIAKVLDVRVKDIFD